MHDHYSHVCIYICIYTYTGPLFSSFVFSHWLLVIRYTNDRIDMFLVYTYTYKVIINMYICAQKKTATVKIKNCGRMRVNFGSFKTVTVTMIVKRIVTVTVTMMVKRVVTVTVTMMVKRIVTVTVTMMVKRIVTVTVTMIVPYRAAYLNT